MPVLLTNSPHLVSIPAIETDSAVTLAETSYPSWAAMFECHPTELDYLLEPGDYRTWGPLRLNERPGHTKDRPKTIRYYNPDVDDNLHPVQRANAALIDCLQFDSALTQHWLVQGLTINDPSENSRITQGASYITVDFCLIEHAQTYSFRIRHATCCTIQRCVIRETTDDEDPSDSSGIQVGNVNADVLGIQILDNEIYNIGDGIQLTHHDPQPFRPVQALIEGNDIYLEPNRYIGDTHTTWDENAIDIKAGSDIPQSTIIRNNRLWGFRRNTAPGKALGELVVLHKYCRNVLIEGNIMGDAPRGIVDLNWPTESQIDVHRPRSILIRNNQFYAIHDYADLDHGAITAPATADIAFIENHFARSDYLTDSTPPSGYRGDGPVYRDNILVDIGAIQRTEPECPPSLVLEPSHHNTVVTAPQGYDTYQRRRWTGPELVAGALPLS